MEALLPLSIKLGKELLSMEETLLSFLTDVGFPIAVTFYLLHRIEGKLNTLIQSIVALPDKIK